MGEIQLVDLTKTFGDLVAVDNLSLTLPDNAYTVILGPSGCGKSTTLRMIAGLEEPTSGDVLIDGENVTDKPPRLRNLSMVFQNLALWNHKTVRENIEFGLRMEGVDTAERKERADRIARILRIEEKLEDNPDTLSGGQRQRVALGRSLIREPDVILLDEPLASLDAKLRLEMRTELVRIQNRLEVSFVHVTHNQEDAMSIGDQILLLRDGRLQQFGSPLDLFERPRNEFVADFIGSPSMNLFDASLEDQDGVQQLVSGTFRLPLPKQLRSTLQRALPDRRFRAGIRPADLRPLMDGSGGEQLQFPATVSIVEPFGDTSWYYLDAGTGGELILKSADERVLSSLEEGDEIQVGLAPGDLYVFHPETGEALTTEERS